MRTMTDADVSVGLRRLVMKLTIFPDLSKTVKTTEVAPFAPALGENLIRPVNELLPGVMTGVVSAGVELGRTPALALSTDDDDDDDVFDSIVNESGLVGGPALPATSVTDADTVHVPSVKVGNEQLNAKPTV